MNICYIILNWIEIKDYNIYIKGNINNSLLRLHYIMDVNIFKINNKI